MARHASFFTFLTGLFILAASAASAQATRRYTVIGDNPDEWKTQVRDAGGEVVRDLAHYSGFSLNLPESALEHLREKLGASAVIEEDPEAQASAGKGNGGGSTTPPAETIPWGVTAVDAIDAQTVTAGAGALVCIADTGIDADHPDLAANIVGGENFVFKKGAVDPSAWDDDNGHGSHVAGTVAAVDNEIGVVGVAPAASLYAVKVLNSRGSGYLSDVADGIRSCVGAGADVINLSLGSSSGSSLLQDAVAYAAAAGVAVVAAAGNESGAVSYPAAYAEAIAVSAMDSSYQLAYYSNFGSEVDYIAPGSGVYSTYKGGSYATLSGTSMAAPHVSGVAALRVASGSLGLAAVDLGLPAIEQGLGLIDAWGTVGGL